jgi:Tfp pilus assembly protein PilO
MKDAGVTTIDSSTDRFRLRLREKELSKLKDMLRQAEKRFLEKEALSSCLSELTSLCNKCKIEVAFFAPHPENEIESEGPYRGILVEINIETTWSDLINFLDELQNLPAMALLKEIDIEVDKEKPPCIGGKLILELWLRD